MGGNMNVVEGPIWIYQSKECARHLYYLNFNTFAIPGECPIWGERVRPLVHTAFSMTSGDEWRKRAGQIYDVWEQTHRDSFAYNSKLNKEVGGAKDHREYKNAVYRISPLVLNVEVWAGRIVELGLLDRRELPWNIAPVV